MTTRYSAGITNLNATSSPFIFVPNTAGEGAAGCEQVIDDYITTVSADLTGTLYKVLRVRTNIKVKSLVFEAEAMTAGKFNVGVYYSDSTFDGTTVANQGTAVDDDFFATDVDCAAAVNPTSITNESGTNTMNKRNQPLWQALGLSTDPGGWFDIVATCHTTAVTTGARLGLRCNFVGG